MDLEDTKPEQGASWWNVAWAGIGFGVIAPFVGMAMLLALVVQKRPFSPPMATYVARHRSLSKLFVIVSLAVGVCLASVSCDAFFQRTPDSVSVSGYQRSDGTRVGPYTRRAPGDAAADREANRKTLWIRAILFGVWLSGLAGNYGVVRASGMPLLRLEPAEPPAKKWQPPPLPEDIRAAVFGKGSTTPSSPPEEPKRQLVFNSTDDELNWTFPNAKSRQIVELRGERYERLFYPLKKGRGGKVTKWGKRWRRVGDDAGSES